MSKYDIEPRAKQVQIKRVNGTLREFGLIKKFLAGSDARVF